MTAYHKPRKSLDILHLFLSIDETSNPYNEHCLPMVDKRNITICTYFQSNFSPSKKMKLFEGDGSLIGFFRILRTALDTKRYDIIHAHTPHVGLLFLMAKFFWRMKLASATFYTIHNSYQSYKNRNKLLYLTIFMFFHKIVCCSRAVYHSFPGFYKRLAGKRLCVIPNGVNLARIDQLLKNIDSPSRNGTFSIISIGRLVELKNPLTVFNAFKQNRGPINKLVYVGDGPLRDSILSKIDDDDLRNCVELSGLIPRHEVYEKLKKADLFISCSRGEGLPVAALEAMACRCPVILSDIPPHREIAQGEKSIPMVHPDDTDGFGQEIKRFREMSLKERTQIGQKCRQLVEAQFSLVSMHKQYAENYFQEIKKHSP